MKKVTARLLMVGNELLYGRTIDTNAAMAARALTDIGVAVVAKETLPDELETISDAIKAAKEEVLIISGGLGPTSDDLTRNAIADAFGGVLKRDLKQAEKLETFFKKANRPLASCNYVQADIPEGFRAVDNPVGTAPALFMRKPFVFALPGVPRELEALMKVSVIPEIKKSFRVPPVYIEEVRTTGIGESILFQEIEPLLSNENVVFSSLPEIQGVVLRFSGRDRSAVKKMAETVRKKCAAFVYGATGDTLEGVLHALCLKKKVTVALAESCTGGLIASKIVSVAGSSRWFMGGVVAYSNNVKETALGVNRDTLVKYGAVSEQTALEMALGAKNRLSADFGLAVTGIAGPDGGTKKKPVGTVVIALCGKKINKSTVFNFFGMRNSIRERAAAAAIFMIVEQLKKLP